ncbi:MAG: hypothetical protein UZ13_00256 [Chloroflexi bacterium OLB13]|nr:MAG: hypothetical protein UZ13_00256 [Chloroflexi bacterium OLB13]
MRRLALLLVAVLMLAAPIAGQEDGLNLPAELYTLKRDGTIQRIGLGAAGVSDVTPPGALTLDFGLSPDGVWMAYRTDGAVGLYNMRTGEQRPLDTTGASYPPYRGRGQSVAWSPQGDAVAYTTETGLRIAVLDGSFGDIVIGPLISLNWSPDGQFWPLRPRTTSGGSTAGSRTAPNRLSCTRRCPRRAGQRGSAAVC